MVLAGALVLLGACPAPGFAQTADSGAVAGSEPPQRGREPTRLYLGMWTMHAREIGGPIDSNWLVGVVYRGYFGGTFVNSFGKRAYTAGIQRSVLRYGESHTRGAVGFRVGAISGYDGRFMRLARQTPVLPIATVFGIVEHRRVGVELSYTLVVASAALTYRF
jgi:hypothetical protein